MEIGTGIFLSAVVISFAAIIIFTRDRVRWGRILAIGLVVLIVLSAMGGLVLYVTTSYEFKRTAINELDGIKLGDTIQDVLFKKGDFKDKCFMDGSKNIVNHGFESEGSGAKKVLYVESRDDVVQRITLTGDLGYSNLQSSNSISSWDDEDQIRKKWGNEDFIRVTSNSARGYVYRKYHLTVILNNNRAVAVVVFNPDYYYKDATNTQRDTDCYDKDGKPIK